jgi:uncharacterized protein YycO
LKTSVIFVHGDNFISEAIETITNSEWAHVGILMFDGIVESLTSGVAISPIDAYEGYHVKYVDIDIPNMAMAEAQAKAMIGVPYSYFDCIEGGLHDLLGIEFPSDGETTTNCSKLVALILRAGGCDLGQESPNELTPADDDRLIK